MFGSLREIPTVCGESELANVVQALAKSLVILLSPCSLLE